MSLWSILQSYSGFVKVILPVKALGLFSKLCEGWAVILPPLIFTTWWFTATCKCWWLVWAVGFFSYNALSNINNSLPPSFHDTALLESLQSWLPGSDLLKNCETLLSLNITMYVCKNTFSPRKISWKKASTETKSLQNCSVCYKVNISAKYIKHNRFATQINSSVCLSIKE